MSINSISPMIRQMLLNKNIYSDSVMNNGLSSLIQNIGGFVQASQQTDNVIDTPDLENLGESFRNLSLINNLYQTDTHNRVEIHSDSSYIKKIKSHEYNINDSNIVSNNKENYKKAIIVNKYKSSIPNNQLISIDTNVIAFDNNNEYGNDDSNLGTDDTSKKQLKQNIVKNKFIDANIQILKNIINEPVNTVSNLTNYLDLTNGIVNNLSNNANNVINNLLGGVMPNVGVNASNPIFNPLNSVNTTAYVKDTPLGIIGANSLAYARQQNTKANLFEETIGNINFNPISILNGGSIFIPNYSITVAKGTFGQILDYSEKIFGFTTPISLLERSSSIYDSENPANTVDRANSMIANTGKGQVSSLFYNINANLLNSNDTKSGYAFGYFDKRDKNNGISDNIYAFSDNRGGIVDMIHGNANNPISMSNYDLDGLVRNSGFDTIVDKKINNYNDGSFYVNYKLIDFFWGGLDVNFNKKSILSKTQNLFKQSSNKMKTLISKPYIQQDVTETNSSVINSQGKGYSSKGSAAVKFNGRIPESNPENMFFRVWTPTNKYDKIENLQKHSGLITDAGTNQRNDDGGYSVLEDTGMVKIGPYRDVYGDSKRTDYKKYMFSIENLAWASESSQLNLIEEEIGNGDMLSGKKGRIMWFPPYDMNFTDNTSVDWEKTNFIGRGEPIYTYNNTTRTGNLDFTILIDHPSYLNNLKGESDMLINSFFQGGFKVDKRFKSKLTIDELNKTEVAFNVELFLTNHTKQQEPEPFTIYFPYNVGGDNAVTAVFTDGYENARYLDGTAIDYAVNPTGIDTYGPFTTFDDVTYYYNTNNGLNKDYNNSPLTTQIFTDEYSDGIRNVCPACRIILTSYGQGDEDTRKVIEGRAIALAWWIKGNLMSPDDQIGIKRFEYVDGGSTEQIYFVPDNLSQKQSRKVVVSFEFDPNFAEILNPVKKLVLTDPEDPKKGISSGIKSRYYSEWDYFDKLRQFDKFVYDSISEKIRFFQPGFHSITPEGFNARLTFLQQCTRQGPTIPDMGTENGGTLVTDNLAFGDAPVCILRIGDFYHTKIIIDTMNFTYEPLVWDLNPEGIGVQPMICKVSMGFSFIGGSSLRGPINKLQNAVSFNFFANTELYENRSDRLVVDTTPGGKAKIVNGDTAAKNYIYDYGKGSSESTNTNKPVTNQELVANEQTGGNRPETTPSDSANDYKRLTISTARWESDTELTLTIAKKDQDNDNNGLSQDYLLMITISNPTTNQSATFVGQELNASDLAGESYKQYSLAAVNSEECDLCLLNTTNEVIYYRGMSKIDVKLIGSEDNSANTLTATIS